MKVERLQAEPGELVEFDEVCTLVNGDQVATGQPLVHGARVRAQVVKHGQEKGIIVFRMKRRRIYQDKFDRQREFTSLKINEIVFGDAVFGKQQTDPRKIKRAQAVTRAGEVKKIRAAGLPKPLNETKPAQAPSQVAGLQGRTPAARTTIEKKNVSGPESGVKSAPQSQPPRTTPRTHQDKPETQNKRRWFVAAFIALVVLLVLIALFWGRGQNPLSKAKPATELGTPADIQLRQTGPVDEPTAPAEPPK